MGPARMLAYENSYCVSSRCFLGQVGTPNRRLTRTSKKWSGMATAGNDLVPVNSRRCNEVVLTDADAATHFVVGALGILALYDLAATFDSHKQVLAGASRTESIASKPIKKANE